MTLKYTLTLQNQRLTRSEKSEDLCPAPNDELSVQCVAPYLRCYAHGPLGIEVG